MKKFFILILLVFIFVAGGYAGLKVGGIDGYDKGKELYDRDLIKTQVIKLAELTTLEKKYARQAVYTEEKKEIFGKGVPFTDKRLVVSYVGIVKVGTDLEQINVTIGDPGEISEVPAADEAAANTDAAQTEGSNAGTGSDQSADAAEPTRATKKNATIHIEMQPCQITDAYIEPGSWTYLDQKSYVFNPLKIEDDANLRAREEKALLADAKADNVIELGNEQAIDVMRTLLEMAYPDADIDITVK